MASRDLTTGPVPQHLRALWIPMMIAMTLQSAYAIVNLVFVTELGDRAVSGLAITIQAFFIVLALGQVLGQTGLAVISQAYGRGEIDRGRSALTTYATLGGALGLVTFIGAYFVAEPYVAVFTNDPEVFRQGVIYFRAQSPTFFLQVLVIVLATGVRASGDVVTPMRIMIMSVTLNAALDPVLMFGADLGIAGAGYATVIAQAMACVVYFVLLRRAAKRRDSRAIAFGRLHVDREVLKKVAAYGLPAGVQFFLIFVLLGIILAGMKPAGPDWTGAAGGGFRIMQQTWLPIVTLSIAAGTIAGQNYGARDLRRVAESGRVALRWSALLGLGIGAAVALAAPALAYLAGRGELQHAHAVTYFYYSAPTLLAMGLTYVPAFMMQAMGRSLYPMSAAVVRVGLVALVTFWLTPLLGWGPEMIILAATVTAFLEGAIGLCLLKRFLRSERRTAATLATQAS